MSTDPKPSDYKAPYLQRAVERLGSPRSGRTTRMIENVAEHCRTGKSAVILAADKGHVSVLRQMVQQIAPDIAAKVTVRTFDAPKPTKDGQPKDSVPETVWVDHWTEECEIRRAFNRRPPVTKNSDPL